MEKEDDYTVSFCPSFGCYTGGQIAETAERVRLEYSDESNDEFEFAILHSDCDFIFPIFNQILIDAKSSLPLATVTTQLSDLFLRDSSSLSDEDDLEGISNDMYCLWSPEKSSNGGWRKSKSTGLSSSSSSSTCSRRWRIRDLLKRCYSGGKQTLKFLNLNSTKKDEATKKKKKKEKRNVMKEEEKRESYLSYRQEVVGFSKKNYYSFLISL